MRIAVMVASLISWCSIIVFVVFAVNRIMLMGGFRRVAMHMRERALKRPANDPLHRLAVFTYTVEASWWKAAERRKWGRRRDGVDDDDDDETAQLVEEGYRLVEAGNKRQHSGGSSSGSGGEKVTSSGRAPSEQRQRMSPMRPGTMPSGGGLQAAEPLALPDAWANANGKGPPLAAKAMIGKWRTARTENYEEFLKLFNMSWPIRKIAEQIKPQPTWYVQDGVLCCSTICPGATTILRHFEEGESIFEDPNLKVSWQVTTFWKGDALVTSEFTPDGKINDGKPVVCSRWVDSEGTFISHFEWGGPKNYVAYCVQYE